MNNFLLVEHGGKFKSFTLQKAIDKKLNLFIATKKPEQWLLNYVDEDRIIVCDTQDITELILSIRVFMKIRNINFCGIGTFFEDFVTQTSELAHVFNLIGNPIAASYGSSRNKLGMREICYQKDIDQPDYDLVSIGDKEKIASFLLKYGDAVIKPIYGGSSVGVMKITHETDLDSLTEKILPELNNDSDKTFTKYKDIFLIEEYLEGEVVSVDGLIQNGNIYFIGETQFYLGKEPKFIQLGGITPTSISDNEIDNLRDYTNKVIKALRFDNCGFHCELRLTSKGPKLIEIASRLPGGPIQLNYASAYGIDSTSLMYDIWLGRKLSINKSRHKYVLYKNIYSKYNGSVREIEVDSFVTENALEVMILVEKDQHVTSNDPYPTLLYYYAVMGDSKQDVEKLSQEIESSIKIIV